MIYSYSKIKTDQNFNEDFKTYSSLGLLQFLPAQLFWNILKSIYSRQLEFAELDWENDPNRLLA